MQLKLKRSQRLGGLVSKSVIFCLDARADYSAEERGNIQRYKLGNETIYNSEAAKKHFDKADAVDKDALYGLGSWKALGYQLLANMKLNISIDSLGNGHHIECKTLDELIGAENAIMNACKNLKGYLETAASFDGREVVIDFADTEPVVVAAATPPTQRMIAAPAAQQQIAYASSAPSESDETSLMYQAGKAIRGAATENGGWEKAAVIGSLVAFLFVLLFLMTKCT